MAEYNLSDWICIPTREDQNTYIDEVLVFTAYDMALAQLAISRTLQVVGKLDLGKLIKIERLKSFGFSWLRIRGNRLAVFAPARG